MSFCGLHDSCLAFVGGCIRTRCLYICCAHAGSEMRSSSFFIGTLVIALAMGAVAARAETATVTATADKQDEYGLTSRASFGKFTTLWQMLLQDYRVQQEGLQLKCLIVAPIVASCQFQ